MATRRIDKLKKKQAEAIKANQWKGSLKTGDPVMVISGGNSKKRVTKGQVAKIVSFSGKLNDRVIVEGLNVMTRHQRATGPNKPAGKIQKEGSIHISNVMYYVEKLKKPVRLKSKVLENGKKVRGYVSPETKEFVQLEA